MQQRLSANKNRRTGGINPKYLFTSLVVCGGCGNRYAGRTSQGQKGKRRVRYECNRRAGFGDCQAHSITETRIRGVVLPPIEALLKRLGQEEVKAAVREELLMSKSLLSFRAREFNRAERPVKHRAVGKNGPSGRSF